MPFPNFISMIKILQNISYLQLFFVSCIASALQLNCGILHTNNINFNCRMGKISSRQMNAMYKAKKDKIDMSQWINVIVADVGVVIDTSLKVGLSQMAILNISWV